MKKCVSASLGVSDVCTSALMCGCSCWDQCRCPCMCTSGPQKSRPIFTTSACPCTYKTGLLKGKGWCVKKCVSASLGVSDVCTSALMCGCSCWDQCRCPCMCTSGPQKSRPIFTTSACPCTYKTGLLKGKGWCEKMCECFPGCE